MDTLVGRRLGKYQLETLVGRGGMAAVYRAHDTVLNRSVAIKVLDPSLAFDPKSVERFRREAVTAANLEHQAIVRVYDVQQEGNIHYIAMRFVQGTTLRDILRDNGALPLDAAINIIRPVADALHYAHRHGVIHRDVKPGNILVEPDGSVLLTDFGISRAADNAQSGLTATGLVMGTADYLAPEQIAGRPAEPRSDVYSLGVLLYEMLTGVTPFAGENTAAVLYRQVHDNPPPLRSVNPRLPPELQPIVDRALAKNPALRYSDSLDLVRDLQEAARWIAPGSPWLNRGRGQPVQQPPVSTGQWQGQHPGTAEQPQPRQTGQAPAYPPVRQQDQLDPHYEVAGTGPIPPAPVPATEPRPGRATWILISALVLILLGLSVLAVTAGLLSSARGGSAGSMAFQPPGPPTYSGPLRTGNGDDLHIPKALTPVSIDGDLSDWKDASPGPFAATGVTYPTTRQHQWGGPDDLSAQFYFAWDDSNFYIGANITDNLHVQNARTRSYNLYKGDDIELWFDTNLAGDFTARDSDADDYQLGLSPGDFGSLGPEVVFWHPDHSDARNGKVNVAAQRKPGNNGYTLEAAVPWDAFGDFRPQPGLAIGFAASAGDNDNPNQAIQELMISTVRTLEDKHPLTFGNLFF